MELYIGEWTYTPQYEVHEDGHWEITLLILKNIGQWHHQWIMAEMRKSVDAPVRMQLLEGPFMMFVQAGRTASRGNDDETTELSAVDLGIVSE